MVVNGMLLLAIWFLLWCVAQIVTHGRPVGYVLGVLAVIVCAMLLLGR